jgi:hypothetical protein
MRNEKFQPTKHPFIISRLLHGPDGFGTTRWVPAPWVRVPIAWVPTGWFQILLMGTQDPVGTRL